MTEVVQLLELARNAQRLFATQKAPRKTPLAQFWEDGVVVASLRQPFDLLAETTAIAMRSAGENRVIPAKSEIWLGNSNWDPTFSMPLASHKVSS